MKAAKHILPIIVIAQFCCTSLWFAGNGIMSDLIANFGLSAGALGHLTSAVQFGFILGTLSFAIFTITDRFSPSKVFLSCALVGALFNLGICLNANSYASMLILRFLTGFFLAGIYPVGMKIAADHFDKNLNKSLGFLVGALVLGTAFPHLAKDLTASLPWKAVIVSTSFLAAFGGILLFILVPDGPYRRPGKQLKLSAFFDVFSHRNFRSAAFGYIGHMWELYAFWAFVPVILKSYFGPDNPFSLSSLSFSIIAIGGIACVLGGFLAQRKGNKKVAFAALLSSCICCLLSPLAFELSSEFVFLGFLLFWGMVVIMDSPLFSAMVAQNAAPEIKGTALTIVNCIGFAITIVSIQVLTFLQDMLDPSLLYMVLGIGPLIGLWSLSKFKTSNT
ncbi:MAG: MFS transporter [Pseudomonadota bacterium]